jgi:hypothetical protein
VGKADFSGGAIGPTGPHCEQSSTCGASIFGKSSTANSVNQAFTNDVSTWNPFSHDFDFDGDDDVFWLYISETLSVNNDKTLRYRKRESGLPAVCPATTTTMFDGSCLDGSPKVAPPYIDYKLSEKQRSTSSAPPAFIERTRNPFYDYKAGQPLQSTQWESLHKQHYMTFVDIDSDGECCLCHHILKFLLLQ